MLAPGISAVVRRIAIYDFDITNQSRTRISAFDQIVAQDGVAWKAMIEDTMHCPQIVQALANECSLAVKILINIGSRVRIDVKPGMPGVDGRKP